jgi:hypothetical protein
MAISTWRDGYGTRGMFHTTHRCRTRSSAPAQRTVQTSIEISNRGRDLGLAAPNFNRSITLLLIDEI